MPNRVEQRIAKSYPRLWRYCFVLTSNRADADDLAQSVSLRALERLHQFDGGDGLERWLFRIAQTVWINELRSRAIRRSGGLIAIEEIEIADPKSNTETNIFAAQVLHRVMALPEAQRSTVFLAYVEGYQYKEVAEILDIPIGTVMSRLAAARKTLSPLSGENVPNYDKLHGKDA